MFSAFQSNAFQNNAYQIVGNVPVAPSAGGGINRLTIKKKYLKQYPEAKEQVEAVLPVIKADTKPDYSALNKLISDAEKRKRYFEMLNDEDETFFILD